MTASEFDIIMGLLQAINNKLDNLDKRVSHLETVMNYHLGNWVPVKKEIEMESTNNADNADGEMESLS